MNPDVVLPGEPAAALDPVSTTTVDELIHDLRKQYTIVIVTHNLQQAARVAGYTAFFYLGRIIGYGDTGTLFTNPREKCTEDYLTGR